ncbi:unconventional myosin-vb-like [Limosa lapponica baueri]|uniref:Unconventional myosin-vb-like n=1 Tax=Limosa lapponica baueri TaxID=1758121 RepID=A0A2I0T4V1_LIMLA|nr:unconventional myosin-vb-like [Limosa lapponica baueri]
MGGQWGIQAQEKQRLVEQLSGLTAAHAEEVRCLRAEMQRLREDAARDSQVQRLQERLAELEKHSMKNSLGQEVEELKQRLAEVEAMKLQLGEEKDAVIQRMLEQSQDLEEQHQRAVRESQGLLQELEEERARYQSLVQDYARLEQGYENLRDEVAFQRQSTLRRSPSSESFLGSESSYLSSMSTAPSRDDSDQQAEASGDAAGDSGVGDDKLLVSQLREEKQQHEEQVEGLHLDICSLKQLSQQQAALIQDLQRHQGQEGLQHHVLKLKEENWELAQKLEKQERTTLKLQKQLRVYAKQIQELTGKCPHREEGVGLTGGSPAWFEAGASPSLNVGSRIPPANSDAGECLLGLS